MKKISTFIIIFYFIQAVITFASPSEDLHLTFVGDLMAHDVNFSIKNFSVIYDDVKDIFLSDDCTFANLEAPVNEKEPFHTYPRFNMNRSYIKAAISAGINAFGLANNHTFDRGKEGIVQTVCSMLMLKESENEDVYFSGIRLDLRKNFRPVTIRKKGWKIGFCSLTQFLNIRQPEPNIHVGEYLKWNKALEFIDFVGRVSKQYDLFIISIHADVEFNRMPDPRKVYFFKQLVKAGCHIVYGHHPHVLQPYENVEIDGKRGLILYSMGNFISGMRWGLEPFPVDHYRSDTGDSIILPVRVQFKEKKVHVYPQEPVLITNHINEKREVVIKKYDTILKEKLSEKWADYYRKRCENMNNFINSFKNKGM